MGHLRQFASCFGVPGQSTFSQPTTHSAFVSPSLRKKQVEAALDRWAATQHDMVGSDVLVRLKKTLHVDPAPGNFRQQQDRRTLDLSFKQLTSFPAEMGQAKTLQDLLLGNNQLTSFPAEMGQVKTLQILRLNNNQLTSFPAEMGQAKALRELDLQNNRLTSFPAEMGKAKQLQRLDLADNQLTSFPAAMGQAKELRTLYLTDNRLTDLPNEIAQLPNLRLLLLQNNRFTRVPRCLLDLPVETEINLRHNPLPEAEIRAVRADMERRRLEGLTVPRLILPPLPEDAGELREAVANGMNVHTAVLTEAFRKRLDDVARQFPEHLCGDVRTQRAELAEIQQRLAQAIDAYELAHAPDPQVLAHARNVAALMFRKGQGEAEAYVNDFDRSTGHVLGYTFLALEAQWARTPAAFQAEALGNGMTALITALHSTEDRCDTRLCEEVMQTIGLPLSRYAEEHKEITAVIPPPITADEMRDITLAVAKNVLHEMLEQNPALASDAPPESWHEAVAHRMQRDHPRMSREQWEPHVAGITAEWETFHELVDDQRNRPG